MKIINAEKVLEKIEKIILSVEKDSELWDALNSCAGKVSEIIWIEEDERKYQEEGKREQAKKK